MLLLPNAEEVTKTILQDQVPLKIHSKAGAFMEIPLLASFTENIKFGIFFSNSITTFSAVLEIQYIFIGTYSQL